MAAKIFPAAKARILEIWDYTEKKWGRTKPTAMCGGWSLRSTICHDNAAVGNLFVMRF